jgi:hypothetical protein
LNLRVEAADKRVGFCFFSFAPILTIGYRVEIFGYGKCQR